MFHFPYLGTLMNRIGGVRACPENAERLLQQDQLVAVFPEGIKGIGKLYKERYQLQRFGRGGFVKLALKCDAPIIPTAVVGAEEIHPMVGKVTWLAKSFGIPYLPVTPTFPFLGRARAHSAADQVVHRVRRAALLQRRVRRRRGERSHPGQQARRAGARAHPGDDRRPLEDAKVHPLRMKLYTASNVSPRRVALYLAEKKLTIPTVNVDVAAGELRAPEFLAKNPLGRVPLLELDDGRLLTESDAIIEYLEELHPEPPLDRARRAGSGRARARRSA